MNRHADKASCAIRFANDHVQQNAYFANIESFLRRYRTIEDLRVIIQLAQKKLSTVTKQILLNVVNVHLQKIISHKFFRIIIKTRQFFHHPTLYYDLNDKKS